MSKKLKEHVTELDEFIKKAKSVLEQHPDVEIDTSNLTFKLEGLELTACNHMVPCVIRDTACIQLAKEVEPEVVLLRSTRGDGIPVEHVLDFLKKERPKLYNEVLEAARTIQQRQDDRLNEYMKSGPLGAILGKLLGAEDPNESSCGNPFCPIHGVGTFRKDEKPKEPLDN